MGRALRPPPLVATLALLIALAGTLALTDRRQLAESGEWPPAELGPPHEVASANTITDRLERLRQLEFERIPEIRVLSAERWRQRTREAAQRGAADQADRREAEAVGDFIRLAGLAPPEFEIEDATEGVGELVGGFYRPKANRLVLVELPFQGTRGTERIAAHELEHALQNQNYPDVLELGAVAGEREIALSALVEGDASVIERRYARRYLGLGTATADRSLLSAANLAVGLPPALVASVRFPYTSGAEFVRALRRRGGWDQVNDAFRDPPTTSEQILHPGKWFAGEEGKEVPTPSPAPLGSAWQHLAEVESGELDAIVILASGVPADVARRAAKGWAGGAFAAYRIPGSDCEGTCRDSRAAVALYRWETDADAVEFTAAAARYLLARVSDGRRRGLTFPSLDGTGTAAIDAAGRTTAIAFGPNRTLATRLAASAVDANGR